MGVHTALVSGDGPEERRNFAAVNLALEIDQSDIQSASPKKPILKTSYSNNQEPEYAESVLTAETSSDADDRDLLRSGTSVTDSTSDSHSTSSRTESPSHSEPATISHSTISIDDPHTTNKSASPSTETSSKVSSKPIPKAQPIEVITTAPTPILKSDDPAPFGVISCTPISTSSSPAVKASLPPLLSFHREKSTDTTPGFRDRLLAAWTSFKKIKTLSRDIRGLVRYLRLQKRMKAARRTNLTVPGSLDLTAAKFPHKVAFYFEDQTWTFKQVQEYSLRVANVFRGKVQKGDAVALLMENRVEYMAIWLGLARLGAVPALLNYQLRLTSLSHCITSASCTLIICAVELQQVLHDISCDISALPIYVSGAGKGDDSKIITTTAGGSAHNLDTLLSSSPAIHVPEEQDVKFTDKLIYIYTSGTTGMPKAAVITHSRYMFACIGMLYMVGLTHRDVLYQPLPLYHTSGGNIGVGMALCDGVTIVLRKKFSVTNYFPDCQRYGCTAGQYIGEICRYLLNTPERDVDKKHKLDVLFGNGLRPQIWKQFQERFNIPRITEFYGSTEGNANIINMDGRVGAVGFVSVLMPFVYPCTLVRVDADTGNPLRNSKGICIRCGPGEPGEFVGKIIANDPVREFKGYADKKATNKKIIHDVWKKGDSAFRSGDLLVMDEEGYMYFKDRTGDTFRWKGENVSTGEVESHLSGLVKSTDVCVYGVEVPHTEGRAGMAAVLDPEGSLDVNEIATGVITLLPVYARPLFLRTVKHMEMTGTYKLRKMDLQKEGYDIKAIKDPVYILDSKSRTYNLLKSDVYDRLMDGSLRL